jgi:hypothetical protein
VHLGFVVRVFMMYIELNLKGYRFMKLPSMSSMMMMTRHDLQQYLASFRNLNVRSVHDEGPAIPKNVQSVLIIESSIDSVVA